MGLSALNHVQIPGCRGPNALPEGCNDAFEGPSPPATPFLPSCPGEPRQGMRGGWSPGTQGEVEGSPCTQGTAEVHRGAIPRKGALSPPNLLLLPHEAIFQAAGPPAPRTATFGHGHPHRSGLLLSQATSLPFVPGPVNIGTPAAGPQFAELQGHWVPRMPGNELQEQSPSLRGVKEDA